MYIPAYGPNDHGVLLASHESNTHFHCENAGPRNQWNRDGTFSDGAAMGNFLDAVEACNANEFCASFEVGFGRVR